MNLALFEKRFTGDDSLMELMRQQFVEADLGAEMHAGTPEQLQSLLQFRPGKEAPIVVHLPRDFNLVDEPCGRKILALAARFAGQIHGMVLHDHPALSARRADYLAAAWQLDNELEKIDGAPMVFVEYAAGLEPADFTRFFTEILDLEHISACIDIGHVGIRAARVAYSRSHPGEDVCDLKTQGPRLQKVISDVDAAVASGATVVLDLVRSLSKLRKPLHFHLHDGHPLSTFSPFGVSDHLSFFAEIPLQFEHNGRLSLPLMFGPDGLMKVIHCALGPLPRSPFSFTLEIHPTGERSGLATASGLFEHWTDKTNAERMNHWLTLLRRNHDLLRQAIDAARPAQIPPLASDTSPAHVEGGPCDI